MWALRFALLPRRIRVSMRLTTLLLDLWKITRMRVFCTPSVRLVDAGPPRRRVDFRPLYGFMYIGSVAFGTV